jgi:hypothetical protein
LPWFSLISLSVLLRKLAQARPASFPFLFVFVGPSRREKTRRKGQKKKKNRKIEKENRKKEKRVVKRSVNTQPLESARFSSLGFFRS